MENEKIEDVNLIKKKGGRKKVYKDLVRTNIYLEREFLDLAKKEKNILLKQLKKLNKKMN